MSPHNSFNERPIQNINLTRSVIIKRDLSFDIFDTRRLLLDVRMFIIFTPCIMCLTKGKRTAENYNKVFSL